jgi:CheY-like chemotaxis protein
MVSGRILLERERLDPWTSASAVVEAVVPAARTKGIELTLRGEPGKHVINADPSRIRQIVSNLVENAIKFTPAGGRIDVVVEAFEQGICIRVCDDGAGLEPAELERVFDRFYQAKRRSSVGLGLGLTIVRHLAELHGGRVEVQSEGLGCGASVSVWLPKSRPTNDVPAVQPRLDPAVQLLAGVRVLVVEDEPDARELLEHVLTLSGAHTVLVEEGRQALELLSRESFDVLLSDIAMPGMDGYELIRRLRASSDDRLRRMPSVALTAYAASRDRRRAMVEGFDVHLSKPIVSDELVRSVASIVGRRQAVSSPD